VSGPADPYTAPADGASPHLVDVDTSTFDAEVIDRSHRVPVVVDLWAAWCGPCRTLGPMLESAVAARDGRIVLAKVDVDANPELAQRYRVQGIPHVLGLRDGVVVAQFTGVIQPPQLEAFLDDLLPSEADQAVARARVAPSEDAEVELRRALELDPRHREAALGLAELLVDRDPDTAVALATPHRPDPAAERVLTRVSLARDAQVDVTDLRARVEGGDADGATLLELGRATAGQGQHDEAIEHLLAAVELGGETRDPAREQLVALFGLLGDDDPRVAAARPRLARALY
jgi:putative thioredoxin